MSKSVSTTELRTMSAADLRKEIDGQKMTVAKMKMAVDQRSHKDTAQFRREKKTLARLLTVLNQVDTDAEKKTIAPLKATKKASKLSAPSK